MSSYGTFLRGRTPTQLRGIRWLTLSDVGFIGTRTFASDGGGGGSASWSWGGTVHCRIDSMALGGRLAESVVAERMSDRSTHTVLLPAGTNVTQENRVAISGRGTYEVTAVRDETDEWVRSIEVVPLGT